MCNIHCHFTLNLSYSYIVRTAPQLGKWSDYFDLHNSILESRAIEFRDWCQWRKFSCCPAASVIRLRCPWNWSAHEPDGSCSNKWKVAFTVSWQLCEVLKTNHKLLFSRYRSISNVSLQTTNFLPSCSFVWRGRAEISLTHGQYEVSILSLTYRPVLRFTP